MSANGSNAQLPADAKARISRYLAREAARSLSEQAKVDAQPTGGANDEPG